MPLFNALGRDERVEPTVLFLAERDPRRSYRAHTEEVEVERRVLGGRELLLGGRWLVLSRGVRAALRAADPDVIVLGGWNQPAFLGALAWGRANRRPVVVWVESTLRDHRGGTAGAGLFKRTVAAAATAFVVPGSAAAAYVRSLAPAARIAVAPNAVDADRFASRLGERERLRQELGLGRCTVLYVGRLTGEKGVDVLVRAAAGVDADVVLAGSGPDESSLRAAAGPNVRFVGQVDQSELPAWYAAADVLALPSRSDPWGMTLNEGAAAGLPLVATEAVGAAAELVEDGVNGFLVAAGDEGELRAALRRLADDEPLRRAAGARSKELSRRFTPEAWSSAVTELAVELARRRS